MPSSENETTAALKQIFSSYSSAPATPLSSRSASHDISYSRTLQNQRAWSLESLKVENEDLKYLVGKLEEDVRGLEEELDGEKGRQWRKHDKAGRNSALLKMEHSIKTLALFALYRYRTKLLHSFTSLKLRLTHKSNQKTHSLALKNAKRKAILSLLTSKYKYQILRSFNTLKLSLKIGKVTSSKNALKTHILNSGLTILRCLLSMNSSSKINKAFIIWKAIYNKDKNWRKFFKAVAGRKKESVLRRALGKFKENKEEGRRKEGSKTTSLHLLSKLATKMSKKRLPTAYAKWVEAVAFSRQVEAKYALALKMLSNTHTRRRIQALSKAWRSWIQGRIQNLQNKEMKLSEHLTNLKSGLLTCKKTKALSYLDTLLKTYVKDHLKRGFRMWLNFSQWTNIIKQKRKVKLELLEKWRNRKGLAWAVYTWKGEGMRRRKVSRILNKINDHLSSQSKRIAWAAFQFNSILTRKIQSARAQSAKDLMRIILAKGKDEVRSKFYVWTHAVHKFKLQELQSDAVTNTMRIAASKIKMEIMQGVLSKVARAFRKWIDVIIYEDKRADNVFLGVDLVRRAVQSFKRKTVAAAWNSWFSKWLSWKKNQRKQKISIRIINHTIRKLLHKTLSTSFNHWVKKIAAFNASLLKQKILSIHSNNGLEKLKFLFKSRQAQNVSRAFNKWKWMVFENFQKIKILKRALFKFSRNQAYHAFSNWAELTFQFKKKKQEQHQALTTMRRVLTRLDERELSKAYNSWKQTLTNHKQLQKHKDFALKLLMSYAIKNKESAVKFGFEKWKHDYLKIKSQLKQKREGLEFFAKVAARSKTFVRRIYFARWKWVNNWTMLMSSQSNKVLTKMITVFAHSFKDAKYKAFSIWRRYNSLLKNHHTGVRHRSELNKLHDQIDSYNSIMKINSSMILKRVCTSITKRDLSIGFSTWLRHTVGVRSNRSNLVKVCRAWFRRMLIAPWKQWSHFVAEDRARRHLQPKIIIKIMKSTRLKLLAASFRTFYSNIYLDHNDKHHRFHRNVHHHRNKDYFYKLACRLALSMESQGLYAAWTTWCEHHEEGLRIEAEKESQKSGIFRVCFRMANKKLSAGFYTWKSRTISLQNQAILQNQLKLSSSNTIKLYFLKMIYTKELAAFKVWKSAIDQKIRATRNLNSYFCRATNRLLSLGWEMWVRALKQIHSNLRREQQKKIVIKRILLRMINVEQSAVFNWWNYATRQLRKEEENIKHKLNLLLTTFKRLVFHSLHRGVHTWKRQIQLQKHAETKLTSAISLMKTALFTILNKELTYGFKVWAAKIKHDVALSNAGKLFARRILGFQRAQLRSGFDRLKSHTNLLFQICKTGDMKLKSQGAAVEIFVRWIRRSPGAGFKIWKLRVAAEKKREEMKKRAATLVIKSIVRSLKETLNRAFFHWHSTTQTRHRLQRILTRYMLNRSVLLALNQWKHFVDSVHLSDDKKLRCCQMLKSSLYHQMGKQLATAFFQWEAFRLDCRVRDGKMRVFGTKLVERLKKWQFVSVNSSFQIWKRAIKQMLEIEALQSWKDMAELNDTDNVDLKRSSAFMNISKTLQRVMHHTLCKSWTKWKYNVQHLISSDFLKKLKDDQLRRVIRRWTTRKLSKGFFTWQINVEIKLRKCLVMTKVVASFLKAKVAATFVFWAKEVHRTNHEAIARKSAVRAIVRLSRVGDYKKITRGWRTWREYVIKEQLAFSKALASNPQSQLDSAVKKEEVKLKMHFTRKAATRVIRRWVQAKAWDAFEIWKDTTVRVKFHEEKGGRMLKILNRIVTRRIKGRVGVSFWVWKVHSEVVKRREQEQERVGENKKYGTRMMTMILINDLTRQLSKGFNKWLNFMKDDRELEKLSVQNTSNFFAILSNAFEKMTHDSNRLRFMHWKLQAAFEKKTERGVKVCSRMIMRCQKAGLIKSWVKWISAWKSDKNKKRRLKGAVNRMLKRQLHIGFGLFKTKFLLARAAAITAQHNKERRQFRIKAILVRRVKMGVRGGFWRWRVFSEQFDRKAEGAKRAAVIYKRRMEAAVRGMWKWWKSWTLDAVRAEHDYHDAKRRGGLSMLRVLNALLRKDLLRGWQAWSKFCWSARSGRGIVRGVILALEKRELFQGFRKWFDVVKAYKAMIKMSITLARLQKSALYASYRQWSAAAIEIKAAETKLTLSKIIMKKVVAQLLKIMLWNGFGRFLRMNRMVKSMELLNRFKLRVLNRRYLSGFNKWKTMFIVVTLKEAKFQAGVRRVFNLLQHKSTHRVGTVERAFKLWHRDGKHYSLLESLKDSGTRRMIGVIWMGVVSRYARAWRTWLHFNHLKEENLLKKTLNMKRVVQKLLGGNMYLSFNLWKKNTVYDPNLTRVVKENNTWRGVVGLGMCARVMKNREAFFMVKGWRKWVDVVRGGKRWMKCFLDVGKRECKMAWRKWIIVVMEGRKRELKNETKGVALKALLVKSWGTKKVWGFEMLKLEVARWRERQWLEERRVASLHRWMNGARRRGKREGFNTWLQAVQIFRDREKVQETGGKIMKRILDRVLYTKFRRRAFSRWWSNAKTEVIYDQLIRGMGNTSQGTVNTDPLKLSKQRVACHSVKHICEKFEKRTLLKAWKVLVDVLSAWKFNKEIDREYLYLEGIMNSFSRLQERSGINI
ncbi:hypothetical protein TrLO_g4838 [Triparma laevis f. longispina]|uniref:Uncharacterized protein n=1 Tax=Triparma laevis f. longispina TaxID=1714387 RepID=A0A9W7FPX3_9STRA|nr:hypothetical protein TrLO_g4838 [Triparma laevis f. longispina]